MKSLNIFGQNIWTNISKTIPIITKYRKYELLTLRIVMAKEENFDRVRHVNG